MKIGRAVVENQPRTDARTDNASWEHLTYRDHKLSPLRYAFFASECFQKIWQNNFLAFFPVGKTFLEKKQWLIQYRKRGPRGGAKKIEVTGQTVQFIIAINAKRLKAICTALLG